MNFRSSVRWTRGDFERRLLAASDRLQERFTELACPALTAHHWGSINAAEAPVIDARHRGSMAEFETHLASYVDHCCGVFAEAARVDLQPVGSVKLLVTGGRDFRDQGAVNRALDDLHAVRPVWRLVHGGARGADALGQRWASARDVTTVVYPARWSEHGRAAGPIRNQLMLDQQCPGLVIAFPGGRGTADMVERAKKAGVEVIHAGLEKAAIDL